jgi:EAL domain-containing protein (putative c-di-GMP-specific phosphodiesterase class I)
MGVDLGQGYLLGRPALIDAAWGDALTVEEDR